MRRSDTHPYLDAPRPLAISHRGFAVDGDENSLAAFQRAVDLGYRYLETDVHATRDGVVVAFHDATLDRVTDQRGRVRDLDFRALSGARIAGRELIPTLEEMLASWPEVRFNIDVKAAQAVRPLVEVLRRARCFHRVCVASFSERRLTAVRRLAGPELATSLGPRGTAALRAVASGRLPRWALPRAGVCAQVPERAGPVRVVDERMVRTAHAAGLQLHAWTVNDPGDMHRLLHLGVDGIVTDRADLLRDVLRARGVWAS